MEIEESPSAKDTEQGGVVKQAETREASKGGARSPNERDTRSKGAREENRRGAAKAIWILALLIILLCALSVVNITISREAYKSSQRNTEAVAKLNESLRELQKSVAKLAEAIEESAGTEEESENGAITPTWDGRI